MLNQTKFGLNYTFTIDSAPNGIPFGNQQIGKVHLQIEFGLIYQDSKRFLREYWHKKLHVIY